MNRKLVACFLGLGLLVAAVLYLVAGDRSNGGRGRGHATNETIAERPAAELDAVDAAPEPEAAPTVREEARAVAPTTPVAWRAQLAGLVGRVVENDGRPVPGMRVALLEADATLLFDAALLDEEEPPSLELEETKTDPAGRFVLSGATASSFHGLGIDLGGPRATVRILEHALVHGERTDIGDVVLAPFGIVTGRVLDHAGVPVSGARVRLAPLPSEILAASVHEFRGDSLLSFGLSAMGGEGHVIVEPPAWIRAQIERLPVPTTYTADDGTFRLEGVALAQVVGGIDKPGVAGMPLGPLDVTDGEEACGDLLLPLGRTVRGIVEDAFGEPAVGAEVYAGAEIVPAVVAILQPCGKTDEDGRFELTGAAESGQIVAAARRTRHEPWRTVVTASHDKVLIEVDATVQLAVNVRDTEGKALAGARLHVTPVRSHSSAWGFDEVLAFLPRPASAPGTFHEAEPGRHVIASLTTGVYDVNARVPGLAPTLVRAECFAPLNEITLVCAAGTALEVIVTDAATKEPVPGARATVLRAGQTGLMKLATGSTDASGIARLGPLADPPPETAEPRVMPTETLLLVRHPRYGDHSMSLPPGIPTIPVELRGGGAVAGRVHWGGAVPTKLYMLVLTRQSDADGFVEMFQTPRFGLTNLAGEFRLANLAPGTHEVELLERFLDQDPVGMMGREDFDGPASLWGGEIEIREGETTELVIDLTPTGRGATARVRGHVRVFGRNLAGADVRVRGNETVRIKTDEWGRFETEPFSVRDEAWIEIQGDVPLASGDTRHLQLYNENVPLKNDDVHEIALDLHPLTMRVEVAEESSGDPVPGAHVSTQATEESGRRRSDQAPVNADGEVELVVLQPGDYLVTASAEGYGSANAKVTVPPEGLTTPTTLRMKRSVPCAGRVDVAAVDVSANGPGFAYVQVSGEGGSSGAMLRPPDYTFEIDGLAPGEYTHHVFLGGRRSTEGKFVLGPDGDRDLVFVFVPSTEEEDED